MVFWLPHWPLAHCIYTNFFFSYDVIRLLTTDKIRKLHEYTDLELFLLRFNFLVLVKTKRAFPPLQPNSFNHRKSKIRKGKYLTCLRNWHFAKPSLIFFAVTLKTATSVETTYVTCFHSYQALSLPLACWLFCCSMLQKPFAKKVVRFFIMILLKLLLLLFYFLKETYYYASAIWSESEGDYNQSLN